MCHLTSNSWIGGKSACTPALDVPVGYVPVANPPPRQVALPHARQSRASQGRLENCISFMSRVAITSRRSQYQLETHDPGMPPKVNSYTTMRGLSALNRGGAGGADNIAAGQTVKTTIGGIGPALPSGITRGTVSLVYSTGPALYEGPGTVYVPVGSFSLKVP